MDKIIVTVLFISCLVNFAISQVPPDRNTLLNGDEGIQTQVAEKYGYPSAKNVLDLATVLKLTEPQRNSLRGIYKETISRAKELGREIVKIEEELKEALQAGLVNEKSVSEDAQQIGKLRGRLRGVFIAARIETRKALNASQIDLCKKLSAPIEKK